MKTHQKFLMVYLLFFIIFLPCCLLDTVHETASTQPRMSVGEATAIMKKAVKDSITDPNVKTVVDVIVYEDGFTLIYFDNTRKRYYNQIEDPNCYEMDAERYSCQI
jgi:hypothetical protein